jgi:hypothetical protein
VEQADLAAQAVNKMPKKKKKTDSYCGGEFNEAAWLKISP